MSDTHEGNDAPPAPSIEFSTRKWVRPEDLNPNGTLFGGNLLRWIDEEAAIYAVLQLGTRQLVTKFISEIDFEASAQQGDLLEMGVEFTNFGRTSLTLRVEVRNMITRRTILTIDRLVFVAVGDDGRPTPHGYTGITRERDRLPAPESAR